MGQSERKVIGPERADKVGDAIRNIATKKPPTVGAGYFRMEDAARERLRNTAPGRAAEGYMQKVSDRNAPAPIDLGEIDIDALKAAQAHQRNEELRQRLESGN